MIKQELTLLGGSGDGLRVSAAALREAIDALLEGVHLATRLAVEGESRRKGPRPAWLDAACAIDITGLNAGSVAIAMEVPTLREADATKFGGEGQRSLFEEGDQQFGDKTAVDLFGQVLESIIDGDAEDVVADRALLDTCVRFARASGDRFEGIQLGGLRGRQLPLVIRPDHIPRIERLRDDTPPPQAARVAGSLDTISASSTDVILKLKDGTRVPARFEDHDPDALKELFGRSVVISGMAHYRPSGRLLMVVAEAINEAGTGDQIFEAAPVARRRLPVNTAVAQDESSGVSAFFGTWPGEETEEELLEALQGIG